MEKKKIELYRRRLKGKGWFGVIFALRLIRSLEKKIKEKSPETADIVRLLCDIQTADNIDTRIKKRIEEVLKDLETDTAINTFCSFWQESRDKTLELILKEAGYLASKPLSLKVLTLCKQGKIEELTDPDAEVVKELMKFLRDKDPQITKTAQDALSSLRRPDAIETVVDYIIANNDPEVERVFLSSGIDPQLSDDKRALFYFVTKQWDKYETVDFEQERPLLTKILSEADERIRQRVFDSAREMGKTGFGMDLIKTEPKKIKIREMTYTDWERIFVGLKNERDSNDLWSFALTAPPSFSCRAIKFLKEATFIPEKDYLKDIFLELANLCPDNDKDTIFWTVDHLKTLKGHKWGVYPLPITPDGSILASGSWGKTISLWSLLFTPPLSLTTHKDLNYIQGIVKKDIPYRANLLFLEALLKARFAFDITIEEPVIHFGEYDITIE